jgi:hypothetical protein
VRTSGTTCPLVSSGAYAAKHDPFVYFDDVTNTLDPNSENCIAHIRPFTEMANGLATGNVAVHFITPNLCDDVHDRCKPIHNAIEQGGTWLSQNLPAILNSRKIFPQSGGGSGLSHAAVEFAYSGGLVRSVINNSETGAADGIKRSVYGLRWGGTSEK